MSANGRSEAKGNSEGESDSERRGRVQTRDGPPCTKPSGDGPLGELAPGA
jgi:hypothetical protein